ncbi:recombinase family protein [Shinella sp. S4-D37]|uniref:recombinase family protein n=1 Tax=Shinella sp. S4-D37 TaxID=3161999 RepID=UPI003464F34A
MTAPQTMSRAALYMRVSTGRQAESDLSIPDQRHQLQAFCKARGWEVTAEFVDAGLSGTDDKRPELQRLLDMATAGAPFDVVLVHSFSRFARDHFALEYHVRKLRKHGIRLTSITQDLGDDPMSVMVRQVFALFDEYQSKENAKHVLRAMQENARQGFWNGARPPFGYTLVVAEQRGTKQKKRLTIDPVEAETVRLIFKLITQGDGTSGPMGVKATADWLNTNGYRTRTGARWGIGPLHKLITSETYKGTYRFNRKVWKTKEDKPESEQIAIAIDAIIDAQTFDKVQAQLKKRNPKNTPPRTVTGPILLTGLATCASCGGGMTLRTGKYGKYRYYTCATCAQKGKSACKGRSIPMDKLDTIVTDSLAGQLLTRPRVEKMLGGLIARQAQRSTEHSARLAKLKSRLIDAETRLKRLYDAIENGIADPADDTLKDRLAGLRTERDIAKSAFERAAGELSPQTRITDEKIESFIGTMREKALDGPIPFRRAWLRALIDNVEVDDTEIRIHGRKTVLEQLVMANTITPDAVPSFVRKWRTRQDSNL